MKCELNGVAVRFDNLEERDSIANIFKENGFELYKGVPSKCGYFAIQNGLAQGVSAEVYRTKVNKFSYKEFMDIANDSKK